PFLPREVVVRAGAESAPPSPRPPRIFFVSRLYHRTFPPPRWTPPMGLLYTGPARKAVPGDPSHDRISQALAEAARRGDDATNNRRYPRRRGWHAALPAHR